VLSRVDCLRLLADNGFGRVVLAAASGHTPIIRPVNYRFDERSQSVVFRTGRGSKFHALTNSSHACFEIDAFDPRAGVAWSVIIAGMTEEVTGAGEISRLDGLGLEQWARGERPHWIRIHARTVSGRQIIFSPDSDS
jgi:nitroimidazol reductase NimA-like FMN-containing flavoprotein (pyridoxamine 5'-phosphate oxidase superfamily)